ncbi:hypothetical protein SAMN02745131_03832 [Flavisolibacter ginsengisoli DSM 18119]|uniref:Outer membrane protein beta-barrel domain-containing protein n=2 Tax=Flavisolibacter TaxID=398041 RepID=A0A1M5FI83_9BACT|nr:hypothetical protein SAMN02745131_03832 [Flavisolibacter ginsengisoli DSM 18119]
MAFLYLSLTSINMKKIALLAFSILFTIIKGNCQLTKGNWLLGGNASFTSTKYNRGPISDQDLIEVRVNPNIGYFFIDKFSGGLKTSILFRHAVIDSDTENSSVLKVGPFIRYYILSVNNSVNIMAEGSYQFITGNGSLKGNTLSFFTGPVIFLNNIIGLEFLAGYSSEKYPKAEGVNNSIQINIGLQIHLEKDN